MGQGMATLSRDISHSRPTLSHRMKRHMLVAAGATSAVLAQLLAEYDRAAAATRRYDELKHTDPVMLRPAEAARSIPRAIFEEFYGGH